MSVGEKIGDLVQVDEGVSAVAVHQEKEMLAIGLYSGVPQEVPALNTQRICGTGFELFRQAGEQLALGVANLALLVGTESMTRNPIAAFDHRGGFKLGAGVAFKDYMWEALSDSAAGINMIQTAENLAKKYGITREEVDVFASASFAKAVAESLARSDASIKAPIIESTGTGAGMKLFSKTGILAGLFGIAHLDSQGVKRVLALGNSQTKFLAVVAQDLLEVIKSFSNVKESLGSVPDGVESREVGKKSLGSANVGGSFVSSDVLLASLHSHTIARVALTVFGDTDNTSRHFSLELILACHVAGVRSSESHRQAESLG